MPVLNYSVSSTNPNADYYHATSVYVGATAGEVDTIYSTDTAGTTNYPVTPGSPAPQIGYLTVPQQVLVNSASAAKVPVTIEADGWGTLQGSGSINVVTAETGFQDTSTYNPVALSFTMSNVGYAATGGTGTTSTGGTTQVPGGAAFGGDSAEFNPRSDDGRPNVARFGRGLLRDHGHPVQRREFRREHEYDLQHSRQRRDRRLLQHLRHGR